MSPAPLKLKKVHISATVDERCAIAIKTYRDDKKNLIDNEKPAKSFIIQRALEQFLIVYLPKPEVAKE